MFLLYFHVLCLGFFVQGNRLCNKGATVHPTAAVLTCDGIMTVYADGVRLNHKNSSYKTAQNSTIPAGSTMLAINCHNPKLSPRILGTINVSMMTTTKGWVCTNQYYPAWNSTYFVDTSWAPAVAYHTNEPNIPYGEVRDIPRTAEWIGTRNRTDSLYCRFSLCPKKVCLSILTTRIHNHRLDGFVFDKFHAPNVGDCALKCSAVQHDRCRSFNFISASGAGTCELSNSSELLGSTNLKPADGVTYYYRT